jgi:polysaccharide export outer membrane protein
MKSLKGLFKYRLFDFRLSTIIFLFVLINSCVTNRKTTYLQEHRKSEYSSEYTSPETYLIRPNDNLYIRVSSPDPTISEIFNAMPGGGTMNVSGASLQISSYPVQLDGRVELPYIGAIFVGGKTLSEAKSEIEAKMVDYVSDASVMVRLVNNYISVLGDVNAPGRYEIYKEGLTIFEALAMAGDVAVFGDRFEFSIIRQTPSETVVKEFNLTDRNIIDTEFYYVLPNDVIYAKPMKGKFIGFSQFPYGLILTTITTTVSLFFLIQNNILLKDAQ